MDCRIQRAAFAAGLVLCAAAARADQGQLRKAKQHAHRAKIHYELGEYEQAAEEYAAVYRIKPVPALLYNMAQSFRRAGRFDKSRELYQAFLRQKPDPKMKGMAEAALREIDELIAAQGKGRNSRSAVVQLVPAPPQAAIASNPLRAGAAPPAASSPRVAPQAPAPARLADAPPPLVADPAATALALPLPPPVESVPVYKKWWFWTAAGAIAVGAGAGIALASGGHGPPQTHFGNTPVF
jgi:tetratricopeptide (TPR) repeat protein